MIQIKATFSRSLMRRSPVVNKNKNTKIKLNKFQSIFIKLRTDFIQGRIAIFQLRKHLKNFYQRQGEIKENFDADFKNAPTNQQSMTKIIIANIPPSPPPTRLPACPSHKGYNNEDDGNGDGEHTFSHHQEQIDGCRELCDESDESGR